MGGIAKGTLTIVGGTGKLAGIEGNSEYTEFFMRPAAEGTFQAYNRSKGQYKLPWLNEWRDIFHPMRLIPQPPNFSNMGSVPSTHIFIENLCRAGYEMGFPKGADLVNSYQKVQRKTK